MEQKKYSKSAYIHTNMKLFSNSAALPFEVIAMAFFLIATITSPVVPSLSLAEDSKYKFGVFGYCNTDSTGSSGCSDVSMNFKPSSLDDANSDWSMSSSVRDKLAKIMVVAPIAAGLTFFAIICNLVGIFARSRVGSSTAYWFFAAFFAFLAFVASALICVVSFLLYYPHVKWPCWILIPAAVFNLIALILIALAAKFVPAANEDDYGDPEKDEDEAAFVKDNDFGWTNGSSDNMDSNKDFKMVSQETKSYDNNPAPAPIAAPNSVSNLYAQSQVSTTPSQFGRPNNNNNSNGFQQPLQHPYANSAYTGASTSRETGISTPVGVATVVQSPFQQSQQPQTQTRQKADDTLSFVPQYDVSKTKTMTSSVEQTSLMDDRSQQVAPHDFTYMHSRLAASSDAADNTAGSQQGLKLPQVYLDDDDDGRAEDEEDEEENGQDGANAKKSERGKILEHNFEPNDDRLSREESGDFNAERVPSEAGSSQSAFTSISQRGVNPMYYRGAQQKANVQTMHYQPQQPQHAQQYAASAHSQPSYSYENPDAMTQRYPMSSPYYPVNVNPQNFDPYRQQQSAPAPPAHQYYRRPQQNSAPHSRSEMILNNSPDLQMIGRKKSVRKYGLANLSQQRYAQQQGQPQQRPQQWQQQQQQQHQQYPQQYPQQRQQQSANGFPTASAMGDSPYARI